MPPQKDDNTRQIDTGDDLNKNVDSYFFFLFQIYRTDLMGRTNTWYNGQSITQMILLKLVFHVKDKWQKIYEQ